MVSLLPTSLLALLFASPVLTAPTTLNDAFRDIALHAPKSPEEPICCLRPLPPLEPTAEEGIFLSFEDWKAKRFQEAKVHPTAGRPYNLSGNLSESAVTPNASQSSTQTQSSATLENLENGGSPERLAPHFRIPIVDRFNYASLDCSARVHAAHKSAKSASSILSTKKDRYMLSPCAEEKQFVIVELCEDIRIDTVQLANYEFFSGVFKDVSVSVAKTLIPSDPDAWTLAGTYRAKNARGVQSFHPPPTLRDFYRFIRIDFHSHYGNEYYCPLSLLRVYGLTHLEEWQWDSWEAESRAKRSIEEASPPREVLADSPIPIHAPVSEPEDHSQEPSTSSDSFATVAARDGAAGYIPVTSQILESLQYSLSMSSAAGSSSQPTDFTAHRDSAASPMETNTEDVDHDSARPHSDTHYNTHVSLSSSSHSYSTAFDNHSSTSIFIDKHSESASHVSASLRPSSAIPNASSLSTISAYLPSAPTTSTGGESIYRTIMNRLTALEANTTLYTRYVEEQTAGMREVLRRLTEDIGRLEGIGKAQAQLYQRSVVELEKQTRRLELEQRELLSRVDHLTDEVVLEKRLGIAQLVLLLTVLVFMALTRGSRGEYTYPPNVRGSVRDWGRRTLSISGGLVDRLRARSSTPPRGAHKAADSDDITFPLIESRASDEPLRSRARKPHVAGGSRKAIHTPNLHIRTPTTNRHSVHHRAATPTSPTFLGSRPAIQRSSSGSITLGFGGVGPVPRSAKRWARTAHLHEVKVVNASSQRLHTVGGETTRGPPASEVPLHNGKTVDVSVSEADRGAQVLVLPPLPSRSDTLGRAKGKMVAGSFRQPSPLRPAANIVERSSPPVIDLSSPPPRVGQLPLQGEEETSEGDAWVDTDVGSESDSVMERDWERTRTLSVPSTISSL